MLRKRSGGIRRSIIFDISYLIYIGAGNIHMGELVQLLLIKGLYKKHRYDIIFLNVSHMVEYSDNVIHKFELSINLYYNNYTQCGVYWQKD